MLLVLKARAVIPPAGWPAGDDDCESEDRSRLMPAPEMRKPGQLWVSEAGLFAGRKRL